MSCCLAKPSRALWVDVLAEYSFDNRYKIDFDAMRMSDCISRQPEVVRVMRDAIGSWFYMQGGQWQAFSPDHQKRLTSLYQEHLNRLILE